MEQTLAGLERPKFRPSVKVAIGVDAVEITAGSNRCDFAFGAEEEQAVRGLIDTLSAGGATLGEIVAAHAAIADHIPALLQDFDHLRLLVDSTPQSEGAIVSGSQLYREIRRIADRVAGRTAKSSFYDALRGGTATRQQLVGYALEYYYIVKMAPGLIAPALASARTPEERTLLQDFLRSELGHDRYLGKALASVGMSAADMEAHQPLPATFALCAALGVYARQHPLSFKAVLFLFERAQPAFIDAFDRRAAELGLPEAFYTPLRIHADLNAEYDHDDITRDLMVLEPVVDRETAVVVKRHTALMIETIIQQEAQILSFYEARPEPLARVF